MADVDLEAQRPLSPHLQIYRPIVTMVMSILHRITGVANYFGVLLVVWWLTAVATGPGYYETVSGFLGSWFGLLLLFGFSWSLIHHAFGGARHLVWDTGRGLDEVSRTRLAWATAIFSVAATIVLWIAVLAIW